MSDFVWGILLGIFLGVYLKRIWGWFSKVIAVKGKPKVIPISRKIIAVAVFVLIFGYLFDTATTIYVAFTNPDVFLTSECNYGAVANYRLWGVWGIMVPDIGSYVMFYIAFYFTLRYIFKQRMFALAFVLMCLTLGILHITAGCLNGLGILLGAYAPA